MTLLDLISGFAAGLDVGDRVHQYDDQGRFDGSVTGRGDGGFDLTDRNSRYAGSMKPSVGSNGFDLFDAQGHYQGTLKP